MVEQRSSTRIITQENPLKNLKVLPESNLGYDTVLELPDGTRDYVIAYSEYLIITEHGIYLR